MFESRSLKSGDEWGVQDSAFVGRVYLTTKSVDSAGGRTSIIQLEQRELKELIEVLRRQVL